MCLRCIVLPSKKAPLQHIGNLPTKASTRDVAVSWRGLQLLMSTQSTYTSICSRSRRMVLRTVMDAPVLQAQTHSQAGSVHWHRV